MNSSDTLDPEAVSGSQHLAESDLAGFLDGDLHAAARARVEAHLDTCAPCQTDLASAIRLVDSFRTTAGAVVGTNVRRRWWYVAVGGAVAAGLASALLIRPWNPAAGNEATVRQPLLGDDRGQIEAISPLGSMSLSGGVVFCWRPTPGGFYRFVLIAEAGERLFTLETSDTVVTLPRSVPLSAGRSYFWRVDGIENGIVASTGSVRIAVVP